MHDLRFSLRSLLHNPAFTVVAVITLALGIGANVAVFSVVHSVLLRPLPFDDPDRLVHLWSSRETMPKGPVSPPDVAAFREHATLFDGIAARFSGFDATLTGGEVPQHVRVEPLTHNYFSVLGVEPAIGRGFLPRDAAPRPPREPGDTLPPPPPAVVISHGLWQRAFGEDPQILERTIELNGRPVNVIGVMPRGFRILAETEVARTAEADMWNSIRSTLDRRNPTSRNMRAIGRLRAGVSLAQAQGEMDALMAGRREQVEYYEQWGIRGLVVPMHADIVGHVRPILMVLLGAVGFLLLLVCSNVANLLVVRAHGRSGEMAVRAAMGCGRGRLVRQLLTESLVLAVAGGVAGLGVGWMGIRLLLALRPADLPGVEAVGINLLVLVFALALSTLAAVLFGLLPAAQARRLNVTQALKDQSAAVGGGGSRTVLNALVVAEVAVSLVLLLGAGLMVRSFAELQRTDPGFDPDGVLTFAIGVYGGEYRSRDVLTGFFRELEERIEALPGVHSAGSNYILPLSGGLWTVAYAYDEDTEAQWPAAVANNRIVTRGYFQAMGIRLMAGRDFSEIEMTDRSAVAIVDEKLAQQAWPNQNPIGRTVTVERGRERSKLEVVGVVGHVREKALNAEGRAMVYWPYGSRNFSPMKIAVRTAGDPSRLTPLVRDIVRTLDPGLAPYQFTTMQERVDEALAPSRFLMVLMSVFSGLAVIVASVGLYGVIAYAVRQRTGEIGVRMAFGAQRAGILRLVVGHGVKLVGLGLALGIVTAVVLARFIGSVLYGVTPTDPGTIGTAALILAILAVAACYIPALRASRIDPIVALRTE